ncbi:MAG: FecR domain-containing protein [Opitutaceae bacterium]|nr:FecR domain-containing protein [Opitutaceae bacterium]
MSPAGESDTAIPRIRREAADWVVRRDAGLTAAEQDDFLQWLRADPRHREWFARQSGNWSALDGLADWRPAHSAEPNPKLLARPTSRRWLAPAMAAFAAAACFATFVGLRHDPASPAEALPPLERRVLADGSVAELNRGAEIEVRYTAAERRLTLLRGEARFAVQKDSARPFLVSAGGVEVRAVGTEFNVSLLRQTIEVTVTEGQVRVLPAILSRSESGFPSGIAAAPLLGRGQRARVALSKPAAAPEISVVSEDELRRLSAWQPQLLDFSAAPLRVVVAEFNRVNRRQLVLLEPALGELPVVASFRSDNLDGFVELLVRTAGIAVERRTEGEIALRRAR